MLIMEEEELGLLVFFGFDREKRSECELCNIYVIMNVTDAYLYKMLASLF